MSWKNRLMKKEKNKRNKQFGIKCKETNHLIELLGMLCLFGLMNLWEVVLACEGFRYDDTNPLSLESCDKHFIRWRWALFFSKAYSGFIQK